MDREKCFNELIAHYQYASKFIKKKECIFATALKLCQILIECCELKGLIFNVEKNLFVTFKMDENYEEINDEIKRKYFCISYETCKVVDEIKNNKELEKISEVKELYSALEETFSETESSAKEIIGILTGWLQLGEEDHKFYFDLQKRQQIELV